MLFVTGHIESYGNKMFMAWAEGFKALVVQGSSEEDVIKELIISLRAKIAYDYKLPITDVNGKEVSDDIIDRIMEGKIENQFKLQLA
jgi:hypothetical protein